MKHILLVLSLLFITGCDVPKPIPAPAAYPMQATSASSTCVDGTWETVRDFSKTGDSIGAPHKECVPNSQKRFYWDVKTSTLKPLAPGTEWNFQTGKAEPIISQDAAIPVERIATLQEQGECSRQAKEQFEQRTGRPLRPLFSYVNHYRPVTGKCVVQTEYRDAVDKQLYDANEGTHLGGLRMASNGDAFECWVADLTGFHKGCNSLESYGALVKKYYGVQQ
jgi:hypothetical protein